MGNLKITDIVDKQAIEDVQKLSDELARAHRIYTDAAKELANGLKINVEVIGDLDKLDKLIATTAQKANAATQALNEQMAKTQQVTAQTTNTISRELAEIEKSNKAKREQVQVDEQAVQLAKAQLGTIQSNVSQLKTYKDELSELAKKKKDKNGLTTEEMQREIELKAAIAEVNSVIKAQVKEQQAAEGSYQQISQKLELLKRAYKGLNEQEKQSEAGKAMADEISKLDAHLKDLSADMGEFQRNVGNYAVANQSVRAELKSLITEIATLTVQYRNMSDEEKNSAEGVALAEKLKESTDKASELRDAMDDVNREIKNSADDAKNFTAITEGVNLLTNGFGACKAACTLLGLSEQDLQEVEAELVAVMTISQAIRQAQLSLQKESSLMTGIQTIQTKALAAAKEMEAKGTVAATVAQRAFNLVAKANPYVLLAAAIVTVVGALAALSIGLSKARKEEAANNKVIEDGIEAKAKAAGELQLYIAKIETFKGSADEEKELVDELNNKYGDQCGIYSSLSEWKQKLIDQGEDMVNVLMLEAQAAALAQLYTENFRASLEADKAIDEGAGKKKYAAGAMFGLAGIFLAATTGEDAWDAYYQKQKTDAEDAMKNLRTRMVDIQTQIVAAKRKLKAGSHSNSGKSGGSGRSTSGGTTSNDSDPVQDDIDRRRTLLNAELQAYKEYSAEWVKAQAASYQLDYEEAMHKCTLKGEERAEYEKNMQRKLNNDLAQLSEDLDEFNQQRMEEVFEREKQQLEDKYASEQALADRNHTLTLAKLKQMHNQGLISEQEYQSKVAEENERYAMEKLQCTKEYLQSCVDSFAFSADEQTKIREKMADIEAQILLQQEQNFEDSEKRKTEIAKREADARKEGIIKALSYANDAISAISGLTNAIFKNKIQNVEEQIEANNSAYDKEEERIDQLAERGAISEEEAEARKQKAKKKTQKENERLEKEKAALQRKQAIFDKATQVASASINIAAAIIKALPNIPLSILIGTLGAIQLATIIATPIPKYAEGTKKGGHPGGLAVVGDGGKSELVMYDGKAFVTSNRPQLVNLPKGAEVFPDATIYQRLNSVSVSPLSDRAERVAAQAGVVVNNDYTALERRTDETNALLRSMIRQNARLSASQQYEIYKATRV